MNTKVRIDAFEGEFEETSRKCLLEGPCDVYLLEEHILFHSEGRLFSAMVQDCYCCGKVEDRVRLSFNLDEEEGRKADPLLPSNNLT